ncbi:MAG: hypothetical protein A2Y58_03745 [Chloroflexi bacterium RBG_13_51_52]|nr:MAG: hypothetical protein A2Y58_03745 [Chloroflexi bacterium RBG_13_51_52]
MASRCEVNTVLIIEDEPDIQNFISRVLELEGYRVLKTGDGNRGLDILGENPVDLLLLDLRLHGRGGWSVLREMKRSQALPKIPVVVITAIAESAQRRKTLRMGVARYLVKPLSAHKLSMTIAGILDKKIEHFTLADKYAVSNA